MGCAGKVYVICVLCCAVSSLCVLASNQNAHVASRPEGRCRFLTSVFSFLRSSVSSFPSPLWPPFGHSFVAPIRLLLVINRTSSSHRQGARQGWPVHALGLLPHLEHLGPLEQWMGSPLSLFLSLLL